MFVSTSPMMSMSSSWILAPRRWPLSWSPLMFWATMRQYCMDGAMESPHESSIPWCGVSAMVVRYCRWSAMCVALASCPGGESAGLKALAFFRCSRWGWSASCFCGIAAEIQLQLDFGCLGAHMLFFRWGLLSSLLCCAFWFCHRLFGTTPFGQCWFCVNWALPGFLIAFRI